MKRLLAIALAAVCCFSVCGCGEKATDGYFLVNGFETYEQIKQVKPQACVGSMDICTEAKYVSEGTGSLRFAIERSSALADTEWLTASADVTLPLSQGVNATLMFTPDNRFVRLGGVDGFALDVYNANAYTTEAVFYAVDADGNVLYHWFHTLYKDSMNYLRMSLNGLFDEGKTTFVSKYKLTFVSKGENEIYYVDNFRVLPGNGGNRQAVASAKDWQIQPFDGIESMRCVRPISYTELPAVKVYYNENPLFATGGGSLCLKVMPYDGTQGKRSAETERQTALGGGVSIFTGALGAMASQAEKLLLDVFSTADRDKRITVTVSDDENTVSQTFSVSPASRQTLTFVGDIRFDRMTDLRVTVDTTESKTAHKIYVDGVRYE